MIGELDALTIVERLVQEKFIDEERYAIAFAKDKFRFSGWGRIKIRYALQQKRIGNNDIVNALSLIDEAHTQPSSPTCSKRNLVRLTTKMSRFDAPNYFVSPRPEGSKPN